MCDIAGLALPNYVITSFFLGCVVVAAVFGAIVAQWRIILIQVCLMRFSLMRVVCVSQRFP